MKENKFYVYVYLDPRKPGQYEYFENGIGISFDFEPFYIGKGKGTRMYIHKMKANKTDINKHCYNKIRKILNLGLNPIIYKIYNNMSEQSAFDLERILGFLIGRKDNNLGPLTNNCDCGGKSFNMSKESKDKQKDSLKKFHKNNPQIREQRKIKEMETKRNNPEIMKNDIRKGVETKRKDSDYELKRKQKERSTKLLNKIAVGPNNSCYKKLNHEFLIECYFNLISFPKMSLLYNEKFKDFKVGDGTLCKFLTILQLPKNTISKFHKLQTKLYLDFLEENKNKKDWYIENYERLEQEYYDDLWLKKKNDFFGSK